MSEHDGQGSVDGGLSRRQLIGAIGAVSGASVLGGALTGSPVGASPVEVGRPYRAGGSRSIASAPVAGVVYETLSMFDFFPDVGTRQIGVDAARPTAGSVYMSATANLPPGAILRDVEWYHVNTGSIPCKVLLYEPGPAPMSSISIGSLPGGAGVRATSTPIPAANAGPFPTGARLVLSIYGDSSGSAQVNGARVGYTVGPAGTMILPNPTRVYDSRETGGAISPDEIRTVSLASVLPVGATAALFALSVTDTHGFGTLRAGRGGVTPTATAIQWFGTNQKATTSVTARVNAALQIAIKSYASSDDTHFVVDVVGYLA